MATHYSAAQHSAVRGAATAVACSDDSMAVVAVAVEPCVAVAAADHCRELVAAVLPADFAVVAVAIAVVPVAVLAVAGWATAVCSVVLCWDCWDHWPRIAKGDKPHNVGSTCMQARLA